jgi:hypothetical protein
VAINDMIRKGIKTKNNKMSKTNKIGYFNIIEMEVIGVWVS